MFENNKIFVLGMARSGYEAAKFLATRGNEVLLNDGGAEEKQDPKQVQELKELGVTLVFGSHPDELLDESFDYLIKNPGIAIDHKYIQRAEELEIEVINEVEMAYRLLPEEVTLIAITGTNGKTTTTTLTYEMLKKSGKRIHLAGNIGYPLISFLNKLEPNDIIVMEISCQQLNNVKEFRPDIALMTNLSVAHIDFLKSYDNYKRVKLKLFAKQTEADIAILNIEDEEVMEGTKEIAAASKYFSSKQEINGAYYKEDALWYYGEKLIDRKDFLLKGDHNVENALGALMIAKEIGVSNDDIKAVLKTFTGVRHRLEFVASVNGVSYYNDTEATNTTCTNIALGAFRENVILLLGGLERNQNFHDLDPYLKPVKQIVGIGSCRERVLAYGKEQGLKTVIFETLLEAMDYLQEIVEKDDIILLSPASASWDQYKQCEDRGDEFCQYVLKLKEDEEENNDKN